MTWAVRSILAYAWEVCAPVQELPYTPADFGGMGHHSNNASSTLGTQPHQELHVQLPAAQCGTQSVPSAHTCDRVMTSIGLMGWEEGTCLQVLTLRR